MRMDCGYRCGARNPAGNSHLIVVTPAGAVAQLGVSVSQVRVVWWLPTVALSLPSRMKERLSAADSVQVAADDPHAAAKRDVLAEHGFAAEEVFPVRWEGWPAPLLSYAALVDCRCASAPNPPPPPTSSDHCDQARIGC